MPDKWGNIRYDVLNRATGKIVGSAIDFRRAITIRNNRDNAYGSAIHNLIPIKPYGSGDQD